MIKEGVYMNYNILFLDVDGTLKKEPNPISENNKKAILEAHKHGKKITIASEETEIWFYL